LIKGRLLTDFVLAVRGVRINKAGGGARATRAKEGSHGESSCEAVVNAIIVAASDAGEVAT
jgi:hypothetical protein